VTDANPSAPLSRIDLVKAALTLFGVLAGVALLWSARALVLTVFLGVLFGLAASSAVDWITGKVRMKRTVAAALVVGGTVLSLLLVAAWTGPTLVTQSRELRTKLPEAVNKLEDWMAKSQPALLDVIAPAVKAAADSALGATDASGEVSAAIKDPQTQGRIMNAITSHATDLSSFALGVLQSTVAILAATMLVIFIALYIASEPATYKRGVLLLVPLAHRDRVAELLDALGGALKTWFGTQLIAMLVIGVVTTILLAIIGVPAALPLGVIAGIFEFIPNIGPTLSAIPAILMGLVDSPRMALIVVGVYWGIQFVENNVLIPYLMREQLDLPPALTLVTQVLMAYTFGFLGLFVAIPVLATAVVFVRMFVVEDKLKPVPTQEFAAVRRSKVMAAMAEPEVPTPP